MEQKVAVEINGGTFTKGRHTRGAALHQEYAKLNNAVLLGWAVLIFDAKHMQDVGACVALVVNLLEARESTKCATYARLAASERLKAPKTAKVRQNRR